jgi:hypothetical protein
MQLRGQEFIVVLVVPARTDLSLLTSFSGMVHSHVSFSEARKPRTRALLAEGDTTHHDGVETPSRNFLHEHHEETAY